MRPNYWRVWELRRALVDGTAAFMGAGQLVTVALAGTALLFALSFPVWFMGRCVFVEVWYPGLVCDPYPAFDPTGWGRYVLGLLVVSAAYAVLYWATLRYGLVLRRGPVTLHATTLFALAAGWVLGRRWSMDISGPDGLSSFATLLWACAIPFTVWLLRVHFVIWATVSARYWTNKENRVEHIVRMLIYRTLHFLAPNKVHVRCHQGRLHIKAPIDAIDVRRVEDLVATRFPQAFEVEIETTLDEAAYWAIYRSELGPSGYVSPALRPPRPVPTMVVAGLVICGVILISLAFRFGPGLGPGITAADLAGFFGVPAP